MQVTNPFWQFSLKAWRHPGCADLCLRLQNEQGCDVNLLLWFLWRSLGGYQLTVAELADLDRLVLPWRQQMVEPVRQLRLAAAADPGRTALREQLLAAELEAERAQQDMMYDWLGAASAVPVAGWAANVASYCEFAGLETGFGEPLLNLVRGLQPMFDEEESPQ